MKFIFSKNKFRVQNTIIKYCADCVKKFYSIMTVQSNAGKMGKTNACGMSVITQNKKYDS